MSFLREALQALPTVASSVYALIAYAVTVLAWLVIAWRIKRQGKLLVHLATIPEKDRYKALRLEMGIVLPDTISPEEWLRSRRQFFLLLGFLSLCATLLVLLALALTSRAPVGVVLPTVPASVSREVQDFLHVRVGAPRATIEGRLGPPARTAIGTRLIGAEYLFKDYYLRLVYDAATTKVRMFLAAALTPEFTPEIPCLGSIRLGSFTFANLNTHFASADFGVGSGAKYVEYGGGSQAELGQVYRVIYADVGAAFAVQDAHRPALSMDCWTALVEASGLREPDEVLAPFRADLVRFRAATRPNAFSVGTAEPESDDDTVAGPWADPEGFDALWLRAVQRGDET